MKKPVAAALIAATSIGGVAAGATLLSPGLAGAQDTDTVPSTTFDFNSEMPDRTAHLTEALQPLVDDGTLTDADVADVIEALEAARPDGARAGDRHGGPRGQGDHDGQRGAQGANLESFAEILGIDSEALGAQLRDGQSLADVAAENGVDTQDLVDAIVSNMEERIQAGVDDGRIDQAKADEVLADAETRAQDIVDGNIEPGGPRGNGGPGGPGGHHGPNAPDADGATT